MPLNRLTKYWLIGMAHVFPEIPVRPEDLPPMQMHDSGTSYLLGTPLRQIAAMREYRWDAELEDSFIRARNEFLARLDSHLEHPLNLPQPKSQSDVVSNVFQNPSARLVIGDESVCLSYRPFGNEIDAMGASLIAITSVGVLSSMVEGAITREEAQTLFFQPTTSALAGKLPFGDGLVSGLEVLQRALFFGPEVPTHDQIISHVKEYLECVSLFFENLEANMKFDPRWAMSTRSAHSLLRHHF